ncbi:ArsR family transcriptional regulator [Sandaracinus amylolyticus]|nr:ArsR family transcriptional regulator [Sandaracinus amylolyticus]
MASQSGIPDDVFRFLVEHIVSVEQLEILLLLRAQAGRDWNAEEVAKELRVAAISAGNRLTDLAARGLLSEVSPGRFRYAPGDPAMQAAVEGLAKVYPERRVSVIEIIFSKPNDVIRTFADAFKLRRDK